MKPLVVTMQAFGSYKNYTKIDLAALGTGLYLVTGDTGAGKTTIFDAIMYALYGAPGGEHRTRNMMRCESADPGTDTVVTLEFEVSGRKYRAERIMHFTKTGNMTSRASLTEPDCMPSEGDTKVTERITEIIGLNKKQFEQIIMLAQGEFRKFLDADSEARAEILGRLFDSSPYRRLQEAVRTAGNKFKNLRKQDEDKARHILEGISIPEASGSFTETDAAFYSYDHPELSENLDKLNSFLEAQTKAAEKEKNKLAAEKEKLIEEKKTAESNNALIEKRRNAEEHFNKLRSMENEFKAAGEKLKTFSQALHLVYPVEKSLNEKKKESDREKAQIKDLEVRLEKSEEKCIACQKAFEESEKLKPERDKLTGSISDAQKLLPEYDDLDKHLAAYKEAEKKEKETKAALEKNTQKSEANKKALKELKKRAEELGDTGARLSEAGNQLKRAKEKKADLDALDKKISENIKREKKLEKAEKELLDIVKKCKELHEISVDLTGRYLDGQAEILERKLFDEVSDKGEAVCPVCHTRHTSFSFDASRSETDIPDKEAVEKASADYKSESDRMLEKEKENENLRAGVETEKKNILEGASKLFGECTWEMLSGEKFLKERSDAFNNELTGFEHEYKKAKADDEEASATAAECKRTEEENEKLDKVINTLNADLSVVSAVLTESKTRYEEIKSRLKYDTRKEAEEELETLKKKHDSIVKTIEKAQKDLSAAKEEQSGLKGSLDTARNKLAETENAAVKLSEEFTAKISEAGFDGDSHYRVAMSICPPESDPEKWIEAEKARIDTYQKELHSAKEDMLKRTEETKDLKETDTGLISERIDAAAVLYGKSEKRCSDLREMKNNNLGITEKVRSLKKELDRTKPAYDRLIRLSDLLSGANGEGGRLSFERHVMGSVFREIVDQANYRLLDMSGGRFELVHRYEASAKNKKAGLELSIQCNSGAPPRDTRTVSGGEAFMVSLALALGLSDVVKNHSGGISMESMFIDEGFGSLDGDKLDRAISVLSKLTGENGDARQIGIISHVEKLGECIPKQILVKNTENGSTVRIIG